MFCKPFQLIVFILYFNLPENRKLSLLFFYFCLKNYTNILIIQPVFTFLSYSAICGPVNTHFHSYYCSLTSILYKDLCDKYLNCKVPQIEITMKART
jgi:hypothetical protein